MVRSGTTVTVAFDVGALLGDRTGVGVAVEGMQRALAARSDVELSPYVLSFRAALAPQIRRLTYPAALAHRAWSMLDHPRADRGLRHPDVVHGTNYVVPPARAARLVTVYDAWFLDHPDGVHPAVARAGKVLLRSIAGGATVHATSQATANRLAQHAPGAAIEVIHLGPPASPAPETEAEAAAPKGLGGSRFIVAIGTEERRKNLPALIEAFGQVVADAPVELVLAGGVGNDTPQVTRAIDRLSTVRRPLVRRLGRVSGSEKAWLLRHAAAVAYPSLDEGFGFPILEAMAARVPVVATAAGSIPEVAGPAALLVTPGDIAALAEALSRVLADEDLRVTLIADGERQLTRFDWATTAQRLADLYHRLAMEGRP